MFSVFNYLHETIKIQHYYLIQPMLHWSFSIWLSSCSLWYNMNKSKCWQPLEVQCKIWVLKQNYLKPTGLITFFISLALFLHMISNEMCQLKWMFCFLGCIRLVWLCVCVLYSSSWMVRLCYMNVITGQIFFFNICVIWPKTFPKAGGL